MPESHSPHADFFSDPLSPLSWSLEQAIGDRESIYSEGGNL